MKKAILVAGYRSSVVGRTTQSVAKAANNKGSGVETPKGFKGLEAWQVSMSLVEAIYRATTSWPTSEQYGLTNQVRRAAVSIPSNIAEGHGRRSSGDFGRFVDIAYGSLSEVETQILIAQRIGYLSEVDAGALVNRINEAGRVIQGLGRYLRKT